MSRSRVVPFSSADPVIASDINGAPSVFRLSDEDWDEIEAVCKVTFSENSRATIVSVTQTYSVLATCAVNAAPLKMAESRLNNFFDAAQAFWKAGAELNGASGDAMYVKYLLRKNFYDGRVPSGVDPLGFIRGLMTSLVSACDLARAQMQPAANGQWDQWIRALTHIFKEQGLKTGVRKDGLESPFSALIRLLEAKIAAPYQARLLLGLLPMHCWTALTASTQSNQDASADGSSTDPERDERDAATLAQAILRARKST